MYCPYEDRPSIGDIFDDAFDWSKETASVAAGGIDSSGIVKDAIGRSIDQANHDFTDHVPDWARAAAGYLVGGPIVAVEKLAKVLYNAGDALVKGERVDKILSRAGEGLLAIVKDQAPMAQLVLSFIPGIGTGVSAVLGAAVALADGKPITTALIEGAKGMIPGGPLVVKAFEFAAAAVEGVAAGHKVDDIALDAVRAALPGGNAAKAAFDTGVALARGKKLQEAALTAAKGSLGASGKAAIDEAIKAGATVQEALARVNIAAVPAVPNHPLAIGAYAMTRKMLRPGKIDRLRVVTVPHKITKLRTVSVSSHQTPLTGRTQQVRASGRDASGGGSMWIVGLGAAAALGGGWYFWRRKGKR